MKTCFKCGKEKDISEFYKHKQMADGHLGKCKTCAKLDSKIRAEKPENIDSVRETKRLWARSNLGKDKHREYLSTEKGRSCSSESKAKYARLNPKKVKASRMVKRAVKAGRIIKPTHCDHCNLQNEIIHGHHCDYDKPLDVIWLCPSCHSKWHRKYEPVNG